jgi:Holliday junction resolvase
VRRAAKRDLSEAVIVDTLRACGWSVGFWSGPNYPDLVVGRHGRTYLVEVKTGSRKLKPGQADWHRDWKGSPVVVLRNVEDTLRFTANPEGEIEGTKNRDKISKLQD